MTFNAKPKDFRDPFKRIFCVLVCGAAEVPAFRSTNCVYGAPQAALCGLTECEICIDFDGCVGRDRRDA